MVVGGVLFDYDRYREWARRIVDVGFVCGVYGMVVKIV